MDEQIENIILDEFTKLVHTIEGDFHINFLKKRHNFLLNQLDKMMIAHMVFVSSFESKSGNAIQACAKRIARLRFGEENVPQIVNPKGLALPNGFCNPKGEQVVITNVNIESAALHGEINEFREEHKGRGRGKSRIESSVTQESIKQLLTIGGKYIEDRIYIKPVDLCFRDGEEWNIMEIKAGGALDSSNAPSNAEKLLLLYTALQEKNCRCYFATLYNKDGEGYHWNSGVKAHLSYPEMFLIGRQFWERILPQEISFRNFVKIYKQALTQIDLNARIRTMISDCVGTL